MDWEFDGLIFSIEPPVDVEGVIGSDAFIVGDCHFNFDVFEELETHVAFIHGKSSV